MDSLVATLSTLSGLDFACYILVGISVWLGLRYRAMITTLSTLVVATVLLVAISYSANYPLVLIDIGPMHVRLASTVSMGLFTIVALAVGHYLIWASLPYLPDLTGRLWSFVAVLVSLLRLWIVILGVTLVTVIWSPILVDTGILREYRREVPHNVAVLTTPTVQRSAVGRLAVVTLTRAGELFGLSWVPR